MEITRKLLLMLLLAFVLIAVCEAQGRGNRGNRGNGGNRGNRGNRGNNRNRGNNGNQGGSSDQSDSNGEIDVEDEPGAPEGIVVPLVEVEELAPPQDQRARCRGRWGRWTEWSQCTARCNEQGFQSHTRVCNARRNRPCGEGSLPYCGRNSYAFRNCTRQCAPNIDTTTKTTPRGRTNFFSTTTSSEFTNKPKTTPTTPSSGNGSTDRGNTRITNKPRTSIAPWATSKRPYGGCDEESNSERYEGLRRGEWGRWGCWSQCTSGVRVRYRNCDSPSPIGPNMYCRDSPQDYRRCYQETTTTTTTTTTEATTPKPCLAGQDVVFVIDGSGSIGSVNYDDMINAILTLIASFHNDYEDSRDASLVRTGIVTYSNKAQEFHPLNNFSIPTSPPFTGGATYTNLAIDLAAKMFDTKKGDRPQSPNVIVVLTDGQSTDPRNTLVAAQAAKDAGIKIIAVGIGTGYDLTELEAIASDGKTDVYNVKRFGELAKKLKDLFSC